MIITARNKMGAAESQVRSQDLWGQVQRRFRFRTSSDINRRNLEFTKQFIQELKNTRQNTEMLRRDRDSGALVLTGVGYDDIIEFINRVDLPEDDLGNTALINHLRKMKDTNLGNPRVVLFNQANLGKPKWETGLEQAEKHFINTHYDFLEDVALKLPKRLMDATPDFYKVRSVHLGNPDDEKLFLSKPGRDLVRGRLDRDPVSFDYLCSDDRDYPGLLIYLFAVAVRDGIDPDSQKRFRLGHGLMPTVGYTVSIPRSENLKGMTRQEISRLVKSTKHSYQVNKIHARLQELSAYEEFDDDE
jgi:hypothetical protein